MSVEQIGLGTEDAPYIITQAQDFSMMLSHPQAVYRLESDINLSDSRWSTSVIPWFNGQFDGNGYTIISLSIDGANRLGLFGFLAQGALLENLGLEFLDVNGVYDVGGLAGVSHGYIRSSFSNGTIFGYNHAGGLLGRHFGLIENCYSSGAIHGRGYWGGLIGYVADFSAISNCYSITRTLGEEGFGGGLVGGRGWGDRIRLTDGTVSQSFWDKEISGMTESDGGTGLTTAQMQDINTYLNAGWDFIDESANGTDDIWMMPKSPAYPLLWWQAAK